MAGGTEVVRRKVSEAIMETPRHGFGAQQRWESGDSASAELGSDAIKRFENHS